MTDALLPAEFAELEPFADEWCLPTERERYAQRLAELDGRDAGVLRRVLPARRGGDRVLRQVPARRHARRRAATCCSCCTRSSWCRSRSRRGASRTSPTPAPRTSTCLIEPRPVTLSRTTIHRPAGRPLGRRRRGEVRSPAVDRRRGRAHRGGRTRPSCRRTATEIDLGDVTLLPGLMDMELNMLLGGPSGGNTRSDVQDDPAFRTLRGDARTAARRCSPASRPCATSGCS